MASPGPAAARRGAEGLAIPDLAADEGTAALGAGPSRTADPITQAMELALAALADVAHTGLVGRAHTTRDGLVDAAEGLRRAGLHTGAALVESMSATMEGETVDAARAAWVDAAIHLLVGLELHQEAAR